MSDMKIYTKTGDDGTTGLLGGRRVAKSDERIDCIGLVDELNAALGWVAAAGDVEVGVQNDLFLIGSHLAIAEDGVTPGHLPPLTEEMVTRLEKGIDAFEAELSPLKTFILPGGCELAARLHLARTVCRRAERRLVAFAADHAVPGLVVIYLNRLSDWLFVQARWANKQAKVADVPWTPGGS
jgi:cob(I)alamin adenosyltransferase